jgi:hypothetical protein
VLNEVRPGAILKQTTNDFAASCLAGEDVAGVETFSKGKCPFIVDATCSIYAVRPFSCRCFVSTVVCLDKATAEVEQIVLTASTVIMQLLEHVSQREYWGNLLDVLLALSDVSANKKVQQYLANPSQALQARSRVLSGQPIPGFLLDDTEYDTVMGLLDSIFKERIDGKCVEDILNGK